MAQRRETLGILAIAVLVLLADQAPLATAEETFAVNLDSIQVASQMSYVDANATGEIDISVPKRTITLSLRFDIAEANSPVAIDLNPPTILGLWDSAGKAIDLQTSHCDDRRAYEEVKWTLDEPTPSGLAIDLVLDPNQPMPSSLSRMEGFICAIYAEEIITADVTFAVDAEWLDATGDLLVTVLPTTPPTPGPIEYEAVPDATDRTNGLRPTAPVALWVYETSIRSTTGHRIFPLGMRWNCAVAADDYVFIKTQLVEADRGVLTPWEQSAYNLVEYITYCRGQAEQSLDDYDSVRHVIAAHPVEVKIPFVLTDVPIPAF